MLKTTTQIIAKEGWKPIIITLIVLFFCWLLSWKFIGFLAFVFLLSLLYFYYNPERIAQDISQDVILAPIDGIITHIENQEDSLLITIKKPICFCGMIRMPLNGMAKKLYHISGLANAQESTGERVCLEFMGSKTCISLILYPKICLRNLFIYFCDSKFREGERIGFFLKGMAKLQLPKNVEVKVSIGDKILAGSSIMGYIR
ncbi:hypothetical protein [Helicobacter canadensis]|uniref:Phosphatidylserine decarboxylase n=1 Tax=Helicobacter canadensis MIT 98-5491 TaxID=537970 RepID=C5ZV00_9HELI|nr:hypothetical protein [Helicobacter canadensis]EES88814.1 conserved hypothetical protein [Helicobacter canadensis MIT 98-5491]EFR48888.1 hypothetical protein HCMG_01061 [Helicobacter canadensis MIT 98-5491]